MFKVSKYPQGTFSWADCASTNAIEAKQFYADLMGWTINEVPIGEGQFYYMFEKNGTTVAALSQIQSELEARGVPSHWNNYVTVDDVDAMTAKAKELGAMILQEPFDIFDSGRMSFFQAPTGGRLALWQAKNHIGAGLVNTPGAMAWNELATRDSEADKKFYSELFGWVFQKAENLDYHFILNKGRMNGGIITITEEWGDAPPNWMTYFSVTDIDTAVEKVKSLAGSVMGEIRDTPGVGRLAIITDPFGAVSTIIQLDEPQPWDVN
jgi:uncharacterized protein